jgi:hypothetical protein
MSGRTSLAVVAAACLVVGGCGGSPEPKSLPKSSPSPSVSASPTPPVMPAAAKEKTDQGAAAFARHFVAAINYVARSGDADALLAISSPTCVSCKSIAERGQTTYANGGRIEGEGWKVLRANVAPNQPHTRVFVDLTIRQAPEQVFASPSASPKSFKGGDHTFSLVLSGRPNGWQATRMDFVG